MKPLDLRGACPEVPVRFEQMYESALSEVERMRIPMRRKLRAALIAALIGALLLAGLAYAASRSRILERLFPSGQPSEAAEQLVRPVETGKTDGPYSFSVDECLFDGNELHVEWTAKSQAGDLAFFTASGLDSRAVALRQQGDIAGLQLNDFVPLGDAMEGTAVSREYHGYTAVTLPDGAGGKPFGVTIRGLFMKPVAPAVQISGLKENISGRPTWLAYSGEDQTFLEPISTLTLDGEGGWSGDLREFDPYMEKLGDSPSEAERTAAYVKGLTEFGYAELLSEIDLTFTVSPDAAHIYTTEIDGPDTFDFDGFSIKFTRAEFSAAHTLVNATVTTRGKTTIGDFEKLEYALHTSEDANDLRIATELELQGLENRPGSINLTFWGDPLPEAPSYVLLKAFRYPGGISGDATDEQNTPVRAPEYDITLRLKKVP